VSGSFAPLRRGDLQLSTETIIARRLEVDLTGTSIPDGGEGALSVEYFIKPELGIFASAFAADGGRSARGPSTAPQ
jgi:hypothetical protein